MLVGGADIDQFQGGEDDDRYISIDAASNKNVESLFDDSGFDKANVDAHDVTNRIEERVVGFPVGRLKLTPSVQRAVAGKPVRVKLSWTTRRPGSGCAR